MKKGKSEQTIKKINNSDINSETKFDPKRLYRSRKDKVIAGVCGGIAEYLVVDPVWIRLVAILLTFAYGIGVLIYILAWIVVPLNPNQTNISQLKNADNNVAPAKVSDNIEKPKKRGRLSIVLGILLVFFGAAFLLNNLFSWFRFAYVWPIAIIFIGVILLVRWAKKD